MIKMKEPVKFIESSNYAAILVDADEVFHFWKKDGSYDGYDKECSADNTKEAVNSATFRKWVEDYRDELIEGSEKWLVMDKFLDRLNVLS
jgi:uncharacterized protein (DUF924 family)